jgi:hypothetical protein
MRKGLMILLLTAFGISSSVGQGAPSAIKGAHQFWAGGEASYFNPDYICNSTSPFCAAGMLGLGANVNLSLRSKFSAAGEMRWLEWRGSDGITESTYLIGPQYRFWDHRSIALAANVLFGTGRFSSPLVVGTYFVYAPGAEFEKRVSDRLKGFISYQYQVWPSWASAPTTSSSGQVIMHDHGIAPNGFSMGVKYRIF